MQSNIFELIDLLVKMSSSTSNIDELKADLDDTINKIETTEDKLRDLENDMSDDKYFDASSEIVDRNIKISLVKKIQKLNKIKSDLEKELDDVKQDEKEIHNKLEDLKEEIDKTNEYNNVINKSNNNKDSFVNMIASENDRLSTLVSKKEGLESSYSKIQKKVEYLSDSLLEVSEKIEKENDRLNEIDHSLSNIKGYIDFDLKDKDEKNYLSVKNELELLINHKDQILNDPVYIASLIKEHIANENKDEVEKEFNHLIEIVKEIPYMSLENNELDNEIKKLDDELKNYDAEISQKEYHTLDSSFIEDRILYLEDTLKNIKNIINVLNSRKEKIDTENELLSERIYRSESQIKSIDSSLVDYENYDYENGEYPKAVVQAANNKLVEEKNNINEIADNYRSDLVKNLKEIDEINSKLELYSQESTKKENELDELNKKIALNTSSKNILEEEKDKLTLEKINNNINYLKYREEFNKSVSEILDEFEMLNSSLEFVDKKTRVQRPFSQAEIKEETTVTKEIKVEENEPVIEEVKEELPIFEEETEDLSIPTINEEDNIPSEPEKEKLRVVEIIPINDNVTEKSEERDYMVNDFQDDDYVDFDSAISKVEEN